MLKVPNRTRWELLGRSAIQAHPVLAEICISKPGALMRPFQIGEWWIIARLEKYKSATFDEAMAEGLSRELFDQWINQEVAIIMEKEWGSNPGLT